MKFSSLIFVLVLVSFSNCLRTKTRSSLRAPDFSYLETKIGQNTLSNSTNATNTTNTSNTTNTTKNTTNNITSGTSNQTKTNTTSNTNVSSPTNVNVTVNGTNTSSGKLVSYVYTLALMIFALVI